MSPELTALELSTDRERAAGGFSRRDGTITFYQRIDSLLSPDMTVLDLGAGRGAQLEENNYRARLARLRGRVKKLIGVDVDPVVVTNPNLDEAHIIQVGQPLPFADATFDLIYSDWVLEHIETPTEFVDEIYRLLKPGGWFCARTPNKWGYIAIMARMIPSKLHGRVLNKVQPTRRDEDIFPKFYRMNTLSTIAKMFTGDRFVDASYTHNPDPAYHGGNRFIYRSLNIFQSVPIKSIHTTLHVFVRKIEPPRVF